MTVQDRQWQELLQCSVQDVLETMFFTSVVGESDSPAESTDALAASVPFHGDQTGEFRVRASRRSAAAIASNFLGSDAPDDGAVAEVFAELANMLCGSMLSRLGGNAFFELAHPELLDPAAPDLDDALHVAFEMDEGVLECWMRLRQ